jgi:PIN domain nuclease of toxin-antitoxin system
LADDPRLPPAPLERVRQLETALFVSQASLWGMAIQPGLGRLLVDPAELERLLSQQNFH